MDLKLKGRTVLVTGSSKGIGAGIARRFAAEGCPLRLAARSAVALDALAASLRGEYGIAVETFPLDLSRPEERARLVAANPDIDILVNNAGAIPGGTIETVDDAAWRAGWELKVFGYIDLTRAYLARMKERRAGVILNIIGLGGERLDYGYICGAMGNASLMALTRAIGGRSPEFGVRVLGINPGPVETDRIVGLAKERAARELGDATRWRESFAKMPFGRPATSDEIAAAAVFLACDLSSYTSGTILTIDGGIANRGGASA